MPAPFPFFKPKFLESIETHTDRKNKKIVSIDQERERERGGEGDRQTDKQTTESEGERERHGRERNGSIESNNNLF